MILLCMEYNKEIEREKNPKSSLKHEPGESFNFLLCAEMPKNEK